MGATALGGWLRDALVRAAGFACAGAIAGVASAWWLIAVNGSIVGAHDALVVIGFLAALGAVGAALAGAVLALVPRGGPARVPSCVLQGALFIALGVALDGLLSALPRVAPRSVEVAAQLVVGLAGAAWFGRRVQHVRRGPVAVGAIVLLAAALVGALSAARRPVAEAATPFEPGPPGSRVMLIGLDGADWRKIDALVAAGRLPTFAKLMETGVRAPLVSLQPTWSPRLWNTIATGVAPEVHGVLDFTETPLPGMERGIQRLRKDPLLPTFGGLRDLVQICFRQELLHEVPITSCHRRAPALWNILSAHDRRVAVVNWFASWPAEPVRGALVSDNHPTRAAFLFSKHGALASGAVAITHPESLMGELAHLPYFDPGAEAEAIVGQPFFADLSDEKRAKYAQRDKYLRVFRVMQTSDAFVVAAAEKLLERESPDLLAVYLSGVDNASHRNFREPTIVDHYYEYTDGLLRRLVARADERTTIVLVSDHGWEYEEGVLVGHDHAPDGVFLASGAQLREPGRLATKPRLEDVAPTVLALLGFPRSAAMEGAPIAELFAPGPARDAAAKVVRSFGPYTAPKMPAAVGSDALTTLQEEGIERLRELGYVK